MKNEPSIPESSKQSSSSSFLSLYVGKLRPKGEEEGSMKTSSVDLSLQTELIRSNIFHNGKVPEDLLQRHHHKPVHDEDYLDLYDERVRSKVLLDGELPQLLKDPKSTSLEDPRLPGNKQKEGGGGHKQRQARRVCPEHSECCLLSTQFKMNHDKEIMAEEHAIHRGQRWK